MTDRGNFPKVFGIGLSRTGTTSLAAALRLLGYRAKHFPLSILTHRRGLLRLNVRAARRYDAITDTPVARLYRELDAAFPGSKFILTTRSLDAWLASMAQLSGSYRFMRLSPKIARLTQDLYGTESYRDGERLKLSYARHQAEVLDYFGGRIGKDLLVCDVFAGNAWQVICPFLGKTPPPDTPFPHLNRGRLGIFKNAVDFFA